MRAVSKTPRGIKTSLRLPTIAHQAGLLSTRQWVPLKEVKIQGLPMKFVYNPSLPVEANANSFLNQIQVGPKFFHASINKKNILLHEIGHFLDDKLSFSDKEYWKMADKGLFGKYKTNSMTQREYYDGLFGTTTAGEAVAQLYSYLADPKSKGIALKQYPEASQWLLKKMKQYKF